MKVLIVGATSKTAEAISRCLYSTTKMEIALLSRNKVFSRETPRIKPFVCDYSKLANLKSCVNLFNPEVIINCVAFNSVDECEINRQKAIDLNVSLVENLVAICRVRDLHLITFSTDYIFDGKKGPYSETDTPNPISYYGRTKHTAENLVRSSMDKYSIIRTNVIFGVSSFKKTNFVEWVLKKLDSGEDFDVVNGQFCNPTYTTDLANVVKAIISYSKYGIYNAGGTSYCSRYEIAKKIEKIFGYNPVCSPIKMIMPEELHQRAMRPNLGGLTLKKTEEELWVSFSDFETALMNYKMQRTLKHNFYELTLI